MKDIDLDNCSCGQCNIDWSKDNGYKYVLDELKATRAHIDEIINVIEKRIEKDAIIDEVLNTDYPDDEKDDKKQDLSVDELIKAIALRNVIEGNNTTYNPKRTQTYPWWGIYPKNIWF